MFNNYLTECTFYATQINFSDNINNSNNIKNKM